jgi:hypothetical protein
VVAVRGSVVAVPLVGWVPLHPPDAAQVWASFALHFSVTGVPMATLLLVASRVTAGFAALPVAGSVVVVWLDPVAGSVMVVWLDDDCPQAVNTEKAAHPIIPRNRRETTAERSVSRTLLRNFVSHPDCNENSDPRLGVRSASFILRFPCDLRWR